ncbi:nucleolar complex protein 2 homolog isoform X2 [Phymastichus coffea]|uniref:nucleolar complex protein 2 homolog isoform X2 n=1 Tax=Phymastichus coffea TaxID=108790 RepID=UPI00273BE785|nr:nucleolar complex protein 2 homolog isoform X2 [Phymastichus coffea]
MKLNKGKAVEKMAKQHVAKKKKKKNIGQVTTDDFFNQDFENMDLSDSEDDKMEPVEQLVPAKKIKKHEKKSGTDAEYETVDEDERKPEKKKRRTKKRPAAKTTDDLSDSADSDLDPAEHRKSLMKLKDIDPEFFKYLKQNDTKLLDFNVSDQENVLSEDDDDDDDDLRHIPDGELEVGSDESDYEPADDESMEISSDSTKVTLKLLKDWQTEIQVDKSSKTIKYVVEAFHAALESISDAEHKTTQYKVEGGAIFNGIIQLCIMQLPDAFKKFLKIGDQTSFEAHKAKRFPKVKGVLKSYLASLIKVFESVSSPDIVSVLLKHLHSMLPFTQSFSSLRKPLLRILLKYWSSADEEIVRVVAFLCIVKIATTCKSAVLNGLQKTMYIKYVENAKFVSPNTLPGINFMRRSLVELYMLDTDCTYPNAFLYIRQLAIHLRNALTLKKKEHFQAVYNWQYINSLWFWADLIPVSKKHSMLRNLIYPLVQIIIGVIKLIPTIYYYPLRFHCVKMLINISRQANVFIPSLPFLTEILVQYDFNRKHKAVSMKPISLMCMLRVSKSQAQENGYKDAIIENLYELIMESAAKDSHTIYFADLYLVTITRLKNFLKKCHVVNYTRRMKQLLDRIEENRKFIENERAKRTFNLADLADVELWEQKIKTGGTPIGKFYESWIKVHEQTKLKMLTQNETMAADFKVPSIKRKAKRVERDSDEDSELEIPAEEMERRLKKEAKKSKRKAKKAKKSMDDEEELPLESSDLVQDIKSSDWD